MYCSRRPLVVDLWTICKIFVIIFCCYLRSLFEPMTVCLMSNQFFFFQIMYFWSPCLLTEMTYFNSILEYIYIGLANERFWYILRTFQHFSMSKIPLNFSFRSIAKGRNFLQFFSSLASDIILFVKESKWSSDAIYCVNLFLGYFVCPKPFWDGIERM